MAKKGIDISCWQGEIDFTKIKQQVDFIILREGYQQQVDKKFFEYVQGCRDNNILIHGVYHFLYPLNNQDVIAEARSCIANIEKAGLGRNVSIWCDLEYDTVAKAKTAGVILGKKEINLFTKTFCDYIVSQGYLTGIYTNCDYYTNYYDQSLLKKYPIWLADYTGKPDFKCIMQQYTSKGIVTGISGNVDMDYCFCADHEEAEALIIDAQKAISIALDEVDYLEKAYSAYQKNPQILYDKRAGAGFDNYTKYGKEMHNIYPAVMDFPAPWCDAFVDWCFYKAYGVTNAKKLLCGDFDDYTVESAQLYKNKKAWFKEPKEGDQVFFTNTAGNICHTGLVTEVNYAKKTFKTVEGNTSSLTGVVDNGGCTAKKSYGFSYSRIAGFGRPPYGQVSGYAAAFVPAAAPHTYQAHAQNHLNNFVNAGLTIDGEVGPLTKKAFRKALQSALNIDYNAGLAVDGMIGDLTQKVLKKVVLRKESRGHLVTVLEIGMLMHGINPNGVECPGIFGNGLYAAVGNFQIKTGLVRDYQVGYHTFMRVQM